MMRKSLRAQTSGAGEVYSPRCALTGLVAWQTMLLVILCSRPSVAQEQDQYSAATPALALSVQAPADALSAMLAFMEATTTQHDESAASRLLYDGRYTMSGRVDLGYRILTFGPLKHETVKTWQRGSITSVADGDLIAWTEVQVHEPELNDPHYSGSVVLTNRKGTWQILEMLMTSYDWQESLSAQIYPDGGEEADYWEALIPFFGKPQDPNVEISRVVEQYLQHLPPRTGLVFRQGAVVGDGSQAVRPFTGPGPPKYTGVLEHRLLAMVPIPSDAVRDWNRRRREPSLHEGDVMVAVELKLDVPEWNYPYRPARVFVSHQAGRLRVIGLDAWTIPDDSYYLPRVDSLGNGGRL